MTYLFDFLNCEILFISDVNSPLDDSVISCASELKCSSVIFVLTPARYLKILSFKDLCCLVFFCWDDDMRRTYDHSISFTSPSLFP